MEEDFSIKKSVNWNNTMFKLNVDINHLKDYAIDHYITLNKGIIPKLEVFKSIDMIIDYIYATACLANKMPSETRVRMAINYYDTYGIEYIQDFLDYIFGK